MALNSVSVNDLGSLTKSGKACSKLKEDPDVDNLCQRTRGVASGFMA